MVHIEGTYMVKPNELTVHQYKSVNRNAEFYTENGIDNLMPLKTLLMELSSPPPQKILVNRQDFESLSHYSGCLE